MTCGIYMIQNLVNGKMYIGQAVDIEKRWSAHKRELRGNYHVNKHLQSAWNKYKEDNFEFTVICKCEESQLDTMEIDYIAKLNAYDPDFGYNKTYGGGGSRATAETKKKMSESAKGKILSDETRKKLSEAGKGRIVSEETRKKLSEANKGKTHSEETKKKLSEAHKGITHSEDAKRKISEASKGRTHTEETKKKLSEARKGITFSEEHRKKLSESSKGKTLSEATKKKISENNSRYWKGKSLSENAKRKLSKANSIPIVQIVPSTNKIVNVWSSSKYAEISGGFNHGNIIQCCKNKYLREGNNIYKSYKWQYLHYYISQIDPRIKKVILFDKEYEF